MSNLDHTKNIIEVENVSFSYDGEAILDNITLNIHQGDYIGLVGPNGAGKTTLLKAMLGLLRPKKGTIRLFGKDVEKFHEWEKIGYVPQKATNFDPRFPATVEDVVLMGRYGKRGLLRTLTTEDYEKVGVALAHVELMEEKDRLVGKLSGGQQQRVFIARALAGEPDIIFLDEPTTGLDTKTQEELYALLKKLNEELGITLVLVSHDVARLVKEVMHVACINRTLECHQTPEEFFQGDHTAHIGDDGVKMIGYHHN